MFSTTNTLELVLLLLASGVLVVAVARLVHLPPLIGYLIAGVALGPSALGLIPQSPEARYLAEFGVVFLMFSIGLEFSLGKIFQMRRAVFALGGTQVLLTFVAGFAGSLALSLGWKAGIVLGAALAMSSTAIVARMLSERMQLDTGHGREVMGILLFQDLAVVPFLVLVPALAGDEADIVPRLASAAGKAAVILFVLLFLGQRLMRSWFRMVARRKSNELFILNVLLITLGLERITAALHVSPIGDGSAETIFAMMNQGLMLLAGLTLIPALLIIIVGEIARIRSVAYYIVGGGIALAAIPFLARVGQSGSFVLPEQTIWQVFATAGFAGGFVYWLIAGRNT